MQAPASLLGRFPLLRLAGDEDAGLNWADWMRAEGVNLPVVMGPAFPSFSLLLLELVAARGIALGYTHSVDQLLIDGRVVRLSDRSLRTDLGFYAVCRDPGSIPVQTIIGLLRKSISASTHAR
jgi:DNA-binding transcriptional LysR family regulator